jgi:hypothetical protein|tara:strand:+ start:1469 stop:1906 length:438 start_codon:yes stop_codon:yes gene_type:complete
MLSSQEAFKLGFLSNCVEKGLSIEQMRAEVKQASDQLDSMVKQAIPDLSGYFAPIAGPIVDDAGDVVKSMSNIAMAGLLLGPPAVGAAGGVLHSRLSDIDEEDVDDVKKRELVDEYQRQAKRLRQSAKTRNFREAQKKRSGGLYL